jgi:Tol biopolymer transport system component
LSWSPDGRYFAYVRAPGRNEGASTLWVLRSSDGEAFALTDAVSANWSPIWSNDPRAVFYVSNRGGSMDLCRQRLRDDGRPEGGAIAVTVGVGMQQAAFSRDGRRLAYSRGQAVTNVWRIPKLADREATWEDAEQLTFDQAFISTVDVFPDGERLVISSDRGGNLDLWTVAIPSKEMTQLTTDPTPDWAPRVSPDGSRIAFHSYRSGNRDIWSMPADGRATVQLTRDETSDMSPAWSADGTQLIFYSGRGEITNAFVVPAGGGDARQVTDSPLALYWPQWSADGAWIAYQSRNYLWRIPAKGGAEERLSDIPMAHFRWLPDGRIYWIGIGEDQARDLLLITPGPRDERRLARLSGRAGRLGSWGLAAGPAHFYFTWATDLGDIWVVDVVDNDE